MSEIRFSIPDLSCPNCTAKIERDLNKKDGIENAVFNKIKRVMVIKSELSEEELFTEVEKTVKRHEPKVDVYKMEEHHDHEDDCCDHEHEHHHDHDDCCDHDHAHNDEHRFNIPDLSCPNCTAKIEHNLNKQAEIESAVFNKVKRVMVIKSDLSENELFDTLTKTVKRYEPKVDVYMAEEHHEHDDCCDHDHAHNDEHRFNIPDLSCPNCTAKIENDLNKLDEIESAVFNKVKRVMVIKSDLSEDELFNTLTKTVKRHEPDVDVFKTSDYHESEHTHTHEHSHGHEHTHGHEEGKAKGGKGDIIKKGIVRIVLGGAFLGAAVLGLGGKFNLALFIIAYLIFGYDVLIAAARNIVRGSVFDENFLMSVATIGAFFIGEYPEAAAVMLFYQVGEFFQDLAVDSSTCSIKELMNLMPEYMNLVYDNGEVERVSPKTAKLGDKILIKNGERVPLDCVITEGNSYLDTSALTGESKKQTVKVGDSILSGCINEGGVLYATVEKTYENATVTKIMDMVEEASANKSETESFITNFARVYTPAVCIAAVLICAIPSIMGYDFKTWLYRALVFLVSSCPCALVVSIPLTFFSGLGAASRNGVLIKGSNYLQRLASLNVAVFDKTGTLTKGVFEVTEVSGDKTEELCAALEKFSNHPIAVAVNKHCTTNFTAENAEEISGHGLVGTIDGKQALAGNDKLMDKYGIKYEKCNSVGTVIYVAYDGKFVGYVVVSDSIKEDSPTAVKELNANGVDTVMLTGDKKEIAERVAQQLGVKKVYAELLPQDKVSKIEQIYADKDKAVVAFVGDGINDAPVLARADVGVAMGGIGSDAAIEAADVVIMNDEVSKLYKAVGIAKGTMRLARQNVTFVLIVKVVVLALAAVGYANMWLAVFADVGTALLAVLNSLRKK
jgi:Cd2+/Zn2+-exporting ATPase